jgi:hypothetical protein
MKKLVSQLVIITAVILPFMLFGDEFSRHIKIEGYTKGFCLSIVGAFLIGFALIIYQDVKYLLDVRGIEALRANIQIAVGRVDLNIDETITLLCEKVPVKTIVYERVNYLGTKAKMGLPADITNLREIAQEEVENRIEWPKHISNTLVLLGLIGTLVGLSFAINEIAVNTGNQVDTSAIQSAVLNGLEGAKTAFYTSLVGIGGMVVLSSLVISLSQALRTHLNEIENISEGSLVKLLFPEKKEDQLALLLNELKPMISDLGQKLDQMAGFTNDVGSHIDHFVEMSRVFESGTRNIEQTYAKLEDLFRAVYTAQEQVSTTATAFAQHLKSVESSYQGMTDLFVTQNNILTDSVSQGEEILESHKDFISRMDEVPQKVSSGLLNVADSYQKNLQPILGHLGEVAVRLQTLSEDGIHKLNEVLIGFESNLENGYQLYRENITTHYEELFSNLQSDLSRNYLEMQQINEALQQLVLDLPRAQ